MAMVMAVRSPKLNNLRHIGHRYKNVSFGGMGAGRETDQRIVGVV